MIAARTPEDFLLALLGTGPLPVLPESASGRARVVELVELHGLEGLAVARDREGVTAAGGDDGAHGRLPADLRGRWEAAYRSRQLAATVVLESADRARSVLAAAGIPSLLFKGAALVADGTYPDPGARRMDDADLLVRPADAERAVALLGPVGFRGASGPWEPGRAAWADSFTLVDHGTPPGTTAVLDLHWRTDYDRLRFGGGGAGREEAEGRGRLWEDADLDGGLPAPAPHLVVVAEHLLKHLRFKVHMPAWGDLARMSRTEVDWDRVDRLLRESRLERGLRALLGVLARELAAPVPDGLLRGAGPAAAVLSPRRLAGRIRPTEHRLSGLLYRWRILGSPGAVLADLAEALLPAGSWLRARYGTGGLGARFRYLSDLLRWAAYRGRSPASPNQELFEPTARE
jgi:hypothetical protein